MSIRLATAQDEPAITAICAKAFFDESLFGQTIHPHRHQFPDDMQIFFSTWMREDLSERTKRVLVATVTENGAEKVVGVATWQRQGSDSHAQKVQREWTHPGPFESPSSTKNRAISPEREDILQRTEPFFKHHWALSTNGLPRSENWYLHLLATHPSYEGQGHGRRLVKWGIDAAREEGVHASVIASDTRDSFYLRSGFDEVVANCCHGEGNPLGEAGVAGGSIIFMWAEMKEV